MAIWRRRRNDGNEKIENMEKIEKMTMAKRRWRNGEDREDGDGDGDGDGNGNSNQTIMMMGWRSGEGEEVIGMRRWRIWKRWKIWKRKKKWG
jgi:hypothetical protein